MEDQEIKITIRGTKHTLNRDNFNETEFRKMQIKQLKMKNNEIVKNLSHVKVNVLYCDHELFC